MRLKFLPRQIQITIPLFIGLLLLLSAHSVTAQTDFQGYRSHYQGAAAATAGGRGGIVRKVTNTNDTGPGSFRDAVAARPGCVNTAATCARIVVFEVSGRIQLDSAPFFITSPYLTIAGQTAPAPGITISHRPMRIENTHDIVIQHIRIRLGDAYYPGHAPGSPVTNGTQSNTVYVSNGTVNVSNIVFDHVSISWATATNVVVYANTVAFLDTIISEGLNASAGEHGQGIIFLGVQYQAHATFARNLLAQDAHRQPWISPGWWFSGYNNLAFNSHNDNNVYSGFANFVGNGYPTGGGGNQAADVFKIAWMNNLAIAGPQTDPASHAIKIDLNATTQVPAGYRIYLSGNTGPYMTLADQWAGVTFMTNQGAGNGGGNRAAVESTNLAADMPWHVAFNYSMLANADVEGYLLANAGARPIERLNAATRDGADYRVTQGVLNRNGLRIVSQNDVGGYPAVPVNTRTYTIPVNANSPGTCGTTTGGVARTIIECDLEAKARALEPASGGLGPGTAVPSPPRNLRVVP